MLDEASRRKKAGKIISVVKHFLGGKNLSGLIAVDVGCSTGFIAHELYKQGATVTGIDIDVPGIQRARSRFGQEGLTFLEYSGRTLPFTDASVDVLVYNHVYEHTVDPDKVMSEIRRVLAPHGIVYLGLGNRFGVVEPHYRLPFLSWVPRPLADRYVVAAGRADHYYERFKSRRGLRRMCAGLTVWDYTYSVLAEPSRFDGDDIVRGPLAKIPNAVWIVGTPIIPTFVWIGCHSGTPKGPALRVPPKKIKVGGTMAGIP
jgi:SAM-dependent methyltransferase